MDDGVLIHENKEYLKYCLSKIKIILSKYKLKLNLRKTEINSIKKELDFLGYRYSIKNNKVIMKVRNDCKKRFKKKMKEFKYDVYQSYKGHFKWGNCKGLLIRYNVNEVDKKLYL